MKKSYLILVVMSVILITAPSVDANFLTSFFQNFVKPGLKIGLGLFKKIFPEGAALTDSVANIFHLGDDPEQQGIKKDTMKRIGTGVREMISKHSSGATNDGSVNVHLSTEVTHFISMEVNRHLNELKKLGERRHKEAQEEGQVEGRRTPHPRIPAGSYKHIADYGFDTEYLRSRASDMEKTDYMIEVIVDLVMIASSLIHEATLEVQLMDDEAYNHFHSYSDRIVIEYEELDYDEEYYEDKYRYSK